MLSYSPAFEMKIRKIFLLIFASVTFNLGHAATCTDAKTGQPGDCMAITQCPEKLERYQKFREMPTLCDARLRTICCPIKVVSTTNPPTTTPPSSTLRVSSRKCRQFASRFDEMIQVPSLLLGEPKILVPVRKCSHEAVPLIVGGEKAREKEFPHMALIGFGEGNPDDYACGGSLISEQWILSAAHCVSSRVGPANFAKLGNVTRLVDNESSFTYKIIERIPHPSYTRKHADNDIALFKLENPIEFNDYVAPICLPSNGFLDTRKVIATGWGKTGYYEGVSESLMKVIIDYFDRDKCEETYAHSGKLATNEIDWDRMICAGANNKTGDTCNGDSGGPIQVFNRDPGVTCMYTIVGITSFGLAYCGQPDVPAIYTKVSFYLDWIESKVWPNQ